MGVTREQIHQLPYLPRFRFRFRFRLRLRDGETGDKLMDLMA